MAYRHRLGATVRQGMLGTFITTLRVVYRALIIFGLLYVTTCRLVLSRSSAANSILLLQRCARGILRTAGMTVVVQGQPQRCQGLLVCNHRSYLDILVLLSATPCAFLCKAEVRRWPLVGRCATGMGTIFVDRSSKESRAESLRRVSLAISTGSSLAAFPEGTTARGPGIRPMRPGLFLAAERHQFAILPSAIEYTDPDDAWVDDDTLLRHCVTWIAKPESSVTLRFGAPLIPSVEHQGLQRRTEAWMRLALQELNDSKGRTASGVPAPEHSATAATSPGMGAPA